MREDKLQEIIELLPYSIRYSGEIEELLDYAKEQAELVQELEEERDEWKYTAQSYYMTNQELREQNEHYKQALNEILKSEINKLREQLKTEE